MAYLGLFTVIACWQRPWLDARKLTTLVLTVIAATGVFLILGSLAWPWAIADPIVRNLATVGGNLAHADPANDHPATMLALVVEGLPQVLGTNKIFADENFA